MNAGAAVMMGCLTAFAFSHRLVWRTFWKCAA